MTSRGPFDRAASDKLRQEFSVAEESWASKRAQTVPCATASELRALRAALRVSLKQFRLRFGVPQDVLVHLAHHPGTTEVRLRPATAAKLKPVLDRARELGLLQHDPGPYVPKAATEERRRRGARSNVVRWKCAACGLDLTRRECRETAPGSREFLHGDPPCGPCQVSDRRERKPIGEE